VDSAGSRPPDHRVAAYSSGRVRDCACPPPGSPGTNGSPPPVGCGHRTLTSSTSPPPEAIPALDDLAVRPRLVG
jgi:hypothetical protein